MNGGESPPKLWRPSSAEGCLGGWKGGLKAMESSAILIEDAPRGSAGRLHCGCLRSPFKMTVSVSPAALDTEEACIASRKA